MITRKVYASLMLLASLILFAVVATNLIRNKNWPLLVASSFVCLVACASGVKLLRNDK